MKKKGQRRKLSSNQKGFIRLLAFCAVFVALFSSVSTVFHPKDGSDSSGYSKNITTAYRAEAQNTIDVVFIGNSNAYRAFNPNQLWDEKKITSCVVGGPMMRTDEVYRYLKDIYKTQSPKQVVLEANCLYLYLDTNGLERGAIPVAGAPYGMNIRLNAELKLPGRDFFKNKLNELEDAIMTKIAYEASLMKYHDRWQSISSYDFLHPEQRYYYVSKGFLYGKGAKPFSKGESYMDSENSNPKEISGFNKYFFGKIYELCREHKTVLSVVAVPSGTNWSTSRHNSVASLAKEYSVDFTDFNLKGTLDSEIDWAHDSKDGGDHMNVYGAAKVTSAYARLLTERFGLKQSVLTETQRAHWENDSLRYHTEVEKSR